MVEYRPFGRTGVQVSTLTLGAMNFGQRGNPDHADARPTPATSRPR